MKKRNMIVTYNEIDVDCYAVYSITIQTGGCDYISIRNIKMYCNSIREIIDVCRKLAKNNGYEIRYKTEFDSRLYNICFVDMSNGEISRYYYNREVFNL